MLIKFYKIKHFWQNNENATWENSSNFDEDIFDEIKQNYVNLCSKKIKYQIINKKYVFFYYDEKKDKFGRKIIELVAFLSSKDTITNPDKVYNDIKTQTRVFNNELEISIEIEDKQNKYKMIYILPIIFIFIFYIFLTTKDSDIRTTPIADKKETKTTSNAMVISQDYSEIVKEWNKSINENKNIDKKYLLENSNNEYIYSQLTTYLNLKKYEDELNKIKDLDDFHGVVAKKWINFRNEIKFKELNKNIPANELYKEIAEIVNEDSFSPKVVLKIVQLNDFCFYYEKNKEQFFKQGLDKKTKCEDVKEWLKDNKIQIIQDLTK